jgi:cell division protein FtsI (penicillin-binding protein 3)
MSIGYEVEMTPLQILTLYNAIANDGRMIKPMFVKEVRDAGKTIEKFESEVLNSSIASRKTIKKLQQMLEGVVENGTAENLFNTVYDIAGKTGTAQIAKGSEGYEYSGHTASFVGYFPADDPKYSCIVVVNKPATGTYYASSVAAPVFKEIADKVYATQLDIHEDHHNTDPNLNVDMIAGHLNDFSRLSEQLNIPVKESDPAAEFVQPVKTNDKIQLKPIKVRTGFVPDVRGMGARDAVYLLRRAGLRVQMFGRGKVVTQSVRPGTRVTKGRKIMIELDV